MSQITTFVDCNDLQVSLFEAWNYNNLGHDGAEVLKVIMSPINRNGFLQGAVNIKDNGLRTVQCIFPQRFLESEIDDTATISCEDGGVSGETTAEYTIDPDVGAKITVNVTAAQLRARCQSNKNYVTDLLKRMMDGVIEKADSQALASLVTGIGNIAEDVDLGNAAGTSTFVTTSTKNSNDILIENASADIDFHFKNNGFNSMPFGIGGRIWREYAKAMKAAGLNELGVDVKQYGAQSPFGLVYSHKVALALGNANDAIFMAPRSVQAVSFNEFKDTGGSIDRFNNGGILVQDILSYPDPSLPFDFDYRAEYVCSGTNRYWRISLSLPVDYVYMPENMYQVGDRKEGVNGLIRFRISNP